MLPEWDLSDKVVYCCADSDASEFVKYFKQPGKCKELIYTSDDFRTHQDLFEKCDIVVTNPPFSLIRVLVRMIYRAKKDFILIQPVLPCRAIPTGNETLFDDYFYFKPVNRFSNTDQVVLCCWCSNIGTKKHPVGYSYKELTGKDIPICSNPEDQQIAGYIGDTPVRKYGKKTGFPPRDFDGFFTITSGNCVSEFKCFSIYDAGYKRSKSVYSDRLVKWRR